MSVRRRLLAATVAVIVAPAAAQTPQDVVVAPGTIGSATTMALVGRLTLTPPGRLGQLRLGRASGNASGPAGFGHLPLYAGAK